MPEKRLYTEEEVAQMVVEYIQIIEILEHSLTILNEDSDMHKTLFRKMAQELHEHRMEKLNNTKEKEGFNGEALSD